MPTASGSRVEVEGLIVGELPMSRPVGVVVRSVRSEQGKKLKPEPPDDRFTTNRSGEILGWGMGDGE